MVRTTYLITHSRPEPLGHLRRRQSTGNAVGNRSRLAEERIVAIDRQHRRGSSQKQRRIADRASNAYRFMRIHLRTRGSAEAMESRGTGDKSERFILRAASVSLPDGGLRARDRVVEVRPCKSELGLGLRE